MDLAEFTKLFEGGVKDFDKFCMDFLIGEGLGLVEQAKDRTPVDTGALRFSWGIDEINHEEKQLNIYNDMEYASYIELGTKRGIKAHNMITVPLNRYNSSVAIRFSSALDDYFKEKGIK